MPYNAIWYMPCDQQIPYHMAYGMERVRPQPSLFGYVAMCMHRRRLVWCLIQSHMRHLSYSRNELA